MEGQKAPWWERATGKTLEELSDYSIFLHAFSKFSAEELKEMHENCLNTDKCEKCFVRARLEDMGEWA